MSDDQYYLSRGEKPGDRPNGREADARNRKYVFNPHMKEELEKGQKYLDRAANLGYKVVSGREFAAKSVASYVFCSLSTDNEIVEWCEQKEFMTKRC